MTSSQNYSRVGETSLFQKEEQEMSDQTNIETIIREIVSTTRTVLREEFGEGGILTHENGA
ncbi:hypothetical protein CL655_03685 [bacterium]|nr:hypothetical protein [bacterium]